MARGAGARAIVVGALICAALGVWLALVPAWGMTAGDVTEYHTYALAFWRGSPPFHALPFEYPPLAILPFTLTLVPAGVGPDLAFGLWMGALALALYVALVWSGYPHEAIAFGAYLLLGGIGVALARYDLAPVALTLAAFLAARRGHLLVAYLLLALAILLKLYPAILLPVFALDHWRSLTAKEGASRGRASALVAGGLSLAALLVGGVFGAAIVVNSRDALSSLGFMRERLTQVESVPATLLWIGTWFGSPAHMVFTYAYNYTGALAPLLTTGASLALAVGLSWVYWHVARGSLDLGRGTLAALCVLLVTSKVLSAQYLLWLLPFVALVYRLDLLWLLICALTTLEYPILLEINAPYWHGVFDPLYLAVIALRNALLVAATLRLILSGRTHVKEKQRGDLTAVTEEAYVAAQAGP